MAIFRPLALSPARIEIRPLARSVKSELRVATRIVPDLGIGVTHGSSRAQFILKAVARLV